ncbi:RTA1 like protein [Cylindrobasidium torrendii FP15055 ss-10]|uniref:RTA1 like protein n=1 Tax=Cylindrobasidium torrendii FP15055 ss-10 TaxID=1314674 RepID=A0A0D7BG55_9AGAR|nr:RTA1 like protein [Cylindrobasidium torrendii FP15055 ss-10]
MQDLSNVDASNVDPSLTSYGYIPNRTVAYIFLVLFALSTVLHLGQGVWFRKWWVIPTIVLAGGLETAGWAGRLWSSYRPLASDPYMLQIVCTILGPTPLLAANFIIFGELISIMGPIYSRLAPRLYSRVFLSCDIISLIVQGAGGGIAASADDHDGAELGGNIMLGGIIFQLVVIVVYTTLSAEFFWRYATDHPVSSKLPGNARDSQSTLSTHTMRGELSGRSRLMVGALCFNLLVLFIRAIYRTIELSDGWNGRIITTEVYFNVLDGAMVVLAIYTFNIVHPGLLPTAKTAKPEDKEMNSTPLMQSVV